MRRAAMGATIVSVMIVCGACAGVLRSPDELAPHEPRQLHQLQVQEDARVHAEAVERAQRFHAEAHRAAMEAAQPQTPASLPRP
jgi:hypothetical protein